MHDTQRRRLLTLIQISHFPAGSKCPARMCKGLQIPWWNHARLCFGFKFRYLARGPLLSRAGLFGSDGWATDSFSEIARVFPNVSDPWIWKPRLFKIIPCRAKSLAASGSRVAIIEYKNSPLWWPSHFPLYGRLFRGLPCLGDYREIQIP